MRRSISICDPKYALAGDFSTWKFVHTTSVNLSKGAKLKFDLCTTGQPIDWEIPQANMKVKKNLIWVTLPNGKTLSGKAIKNDQGILSQFEFILPSEIKSTETFTIHVGSWNNKKEEGNRAQTHLQRRRCFHLYIDTKGKGEYKEPEVFQMDVRGNVLKNMRAIVPSVVMRNKRFDVIVRFEDQHGNLTSNAPEGTLIDLSYDHLRESLSWKLFVPETGFLTLPNLYFNEPGNYRFKLVDTQSKETFFSPPIRCFPEGDRSLFWGLFHGESEKVESSQNMENCLRHFRDEKSLQFYTSSPFEQETKQEEWKQIGTQVAEFNEDDRFNALLGFQWSGDPKTEGLRQFVFSKELKTLLRKNELRGNSLSKIYKFFQPKEMISIPSFTMSKKTPYSFEEYHPDYERVVEIYNAWGSSECLAKEGNQRPIINPKKKVEAAEGSIQKALLAGCRFGFVAGGLDDRGVYDEMYDSGQTQYSPGLTGIYAKDQSKSSLIDAIYNRSCYATTGKRIILGFDIAAKPMGSELSTGTKPGLSFNRHLSGFVLGTDMIKEFSIIRNGKTLHTITPNTDTYEFTFDDSEPFSNIVLKTKKAPFPFVYYYIRITQADGHIAWSSPIWIDQEEAVAIPIPKKVKKK